MEAKSRYQVIGELEAQKRAFIERKSNLLKGVVEREDKIVDLERNKEDVMRELTRRLEDAAKDLANYKANLQNEQNTLDELIKSIDISLSRINSQS